MTESCPPGHLTQTVPAECPAGRPTVDADA